MLEKNYGILTVEEVSEGFMQLVENCGNGAAVIVFKVLILSRQSTSAFSSTSLSGSATDGVSRLHYSYCLRHGLPSHGPQ